MIAQAKPASQAGESRHLRSYRRRYRPAIYDLTGVGAGREVVEWRENVCRRRCRSTARGIRRPTVRNARSCWEPRAIIASMLSPCWATLRIRPQPSHAKAGINSDSHRIYCHSVPSRVVSVHAKSRANSRTGVCPPRGATGSQWNVRKPFLYGLQTSRGTIGIPGRLPSGPLPGNGRSCSRNRIDPWRKGVIAYSRCY